MSRDDVWKINETFLNQQMLQNKQFLFSHNPKTADPKSFFGRETKYLQDRGYEFEQDGNWGWKAVKK